MVIGVFGAGGNGRTIYRCFEKINEVYHKWSEIVFIDDVIEEKVLCGIRVLKSKEAFEEFTPDQIELVISIGEPANREKVYNLIHSYGYRLASVASPSAFLSSDFQGEEGYMIGNAHISDNCRFGKNVYISEFVTVGHDVNIKDHSLVSPNTFIAGYVEVGNRVYIGPGAVIKDRIKIGDDAIIAPGAAVFRDVPAGHTAIGNPAKIIKNDNKGVFH